MRIQPCLFLQQSSGVPPHSRLSVEDAEDYQVGLYYLRRLLLLAGLYYYGRQKNFQTRQLICPHMQQAVTLSPQFLEVVRSHCSSWASKQFSVVLTQAARAECVALREQLSSQTLKFSSEISEVRLKYDQQVPSEFLGAHLLFVPSFLLCTDV